MSQDNVSVLATNGENMPESLNSEVPANGILAESSDVSVGALVEENTALKATLMQTLKEQNVVSQTFFPALFSQQQRGALSQKYAQKYAKMRAEIAAHQSMFPAYANDTAMLYVLTQMFNEANDKIASDLRDGHVSNLYTMVTGFTLAEVLTDYQVKRNAEVDREIKELADKIGENHRERVNILKAVRKYWITSFDVGYRDQMDRKLRRAAHILGVSQQELE